MISCCGEGEAKSGNQLERVREQRGEGREERTLGGSLRTSALIRRRKLENEGGRTMSPLRVGRRGKERGNATH